MWGFSFCGWPGQVPSFKQCLSPAVVALLKKFGVSPVLAVQIQGELLPIDATAIDVYMIAYDMLKGRV